MTSLIKAVKSGDREAMRMALADDFDPNERDGKSGKSVLHLCVEYDEMDVLRRVLEGKKVDVLGKNAKGDVWLLDSVANSVEIVEC